MSNYIENSYISLFYIQGVSIPMLDMIDDQARAFFNVVVGATWLFTGKFTQLEIYEWGLI